MKKAIYLSVFIFLLTISLSAVVKAEKMEVKAPVENIGDDPEKAKAEATEKKDDKSETKEDKTCDKKEKSSCCKKE